MRPLSFSASLLLSFSASLLLSFFTMSYISRADIIPLVPTGWITQALDDDSDGDEDDDLFDQIRDAAERGVNAVLSLQYKTPIDNPDDVPFIKQVTSLEAARILYTRRGYDSKGYPHFDAWTAAWTMLGKIGDGRLQLAPGENTNAQIAKPRGSVITGPARTHSTSGGFTA